MLQFPFLDRVRKQMVRKKTVLVLLVANVLAPIRSVVLLAYFHPFLISIFGQLLWTVKQRRHPYAIKCSLCDALKGVIVLLQSIATLHHRSEWSHLLLDMFKRHADSDVDVSIKPIENNSINDHSKPLTSFTSMFSGCCMANDTDIVDIADSTSTYELLQSNIESNVVLPSPIE